MKHILPTALLIAALRAASANDQQPPAASSSLNAPVASISGKVTETMNGGGYTYVQVNTGAKKVWAAVPEIKLKTGDAVVITDGMAMANHHSKTLNRDFDLIYFSGDITINGKRLAAAEKTVELPKNHPPITGSAVTPTVDLTGIKKAVGGKTIEAVYADTKKLAGKQVAVRGKVVKYNAMILGKNWLHLRDGTGSKGNNDLLVTSSAPAKVGDTVLATGAIALNKDFGSNYKYDVMIEDAKIVVEK